jgi:hypothetical protein
MGLAIMAADNSTKPVTNTGTIEAAYRKLTDQWLLLITLLRSLFGTFR